MADSSDTQVSKTDLFQELFDRLLGDVAALGSDEARTDPVQRRSYVRAVFALIEGGTYAVKQYALEKKASKFTTAEQAMLREEEHYLDPQGRAKTRPARLSCLANVRLGFTALAKWCDASHQPNYGGQGWEAICGAIKIRDRLMHPKETVDLEVTDDEMAMVESAHRWYVANIVLCLKSTIDVMTQELTKRGVTAKTQLTSEQLERLFHLYPLYAD